MPRSSDRPKTSWSQETRFLYFGIPVTVRFAPADRALARRVWAGLEAIDGEFNDYRDTSSIGRINAGGPGTYELSPLLEEAFDLAEHMWNVTQGVCEITVGALRRLWKGAAKQGVWPEDHAIAAARATIGTHSYRRHGRRLEVIVPGTVFDFGGICKGLAVDKAVAALKQARRVAALVQVGGESCCWGVAPAGRPHRLAIPHPAAPDDTNRPWAMVADRGCGFCGSTSANYHLPIRVGGRVIYHIYDPRTGSPADGGNLSFSVVLPGVGRNGEADVLTKTGILLGEEGLAIVAGLGGQALLLRRGERGDIQALQTPGWMDCCSGPGMDCAFDF